MLLPLSYALVAPDKVIMNSAPCPKGSAAQQHAWSLKRFASILAIWHHACTCRDFAVYNVLRSAMTASGMAFAYIRIRQCHVVVTHDSQQSSV